MSTLIKKGYTELYSILLKNEDMLVSEVMELLIPVMETQVRDTAHYTDEDGRLVVFCYYHKQYEHVDQVPYGSKKNTVTGLNTMCKVGTNQWTKQQRDYTKSADTILSLIESGELAHTKKAIAEKREEFMAIKKRIIPLEVHHWNEAHADERQIES
jgi:hypothetical protein